MSDVTAVKQALAYLTVGQGSANLAMAGIKKPDWDALAVLVEAVRRWVRIVPALRRLADAVDDLWLEIENHGDVPDLQEAWDELLDASTEVRAALADHLTGETE